MQVDAQLVRHMAKLAQLAVTDAQVPVLAQDLARVLELVAVLDELDVTDVAPLVHPHAESLALRPDVVRPSLDQQKALENTADRDDGYFLTPRVIG